MSVSERKSIVNQFLMLLFISLAGMVGQNIKKKLNEKRKKGKKIKAVKKVCFFVGILILLVSIGWLVYTHLYGYGFWNITSNKNIYPNQIAKYEATIPQHNLPSAPWPFVGRNNELQEITALF